MDTIMADQENRTHSDKFMLRLPDGMRDRIKLAAEANNRSMNAEIVATLEERYPAPSLEMELRKLDAVIQSISKYLNDHPDNDTLRLERNRLRRAFHEIIKETSDKPPP